MSFKVSVSRRTRAAVRRRIWRKIHLYLGLFVGFVFAFSGLTGSALVFYQDIDEYLNPALLTVEPGRTVIPLSKIVAAAQREVPPEAKLARLDLPRHPRAAMKIRFSLSRGNKDILLEVMVNPFTAEVLGQREWGGYFMSFLYTLHYTLMLGDTGKTIIGAMGMLIMCSLLSGIYLWWPKLYELFRALTFKRSANRLRFIYDLHKTIGIYASVILVIITFSGIYMIFPHYVKPVVGWISPLTDFTLPKQSVETDIKSLNIDEMVATAGDLFPQAELKRIFFPASGESVYRIAMRQSGNVRKNSGSTQVWINSYDGKVLLIKNSQAMSGGDTFINWMFPLHNGEAFGLAGRVIIFISGFVPITLYITGLMVWWRKHHARIRRDSGI